MPAGLGEKECRQSKEKMTAKIPTPVMYLSLMVVFAIVIFAGLQLMSVQQISDTATQPKKYDYTGFRVKYDLDFKNKYTGSAVNPTVYVYSSKPDNWGNCRVDAEDGYIDTGDASSGSYTVQEECGHYYIRADLSGYYCEYLEIDIPCSGESNLNDYNSEPASVSVKMVQEDSSFGISDIDLGISTNETSDITYTKTATYTVAEDKGWYLDEVKVQEDATYSFATDTDGDGIYDEGVNKIEIQVSGGGQSCPTWVPFEVATSVNEFGGDDEATLDCDLELGEEETLTLLVKVTCDQTLVTTGDADEKCGNGEDFLDDIIMVSKLGSTDTVAVTG